VYRIAADLAREVAAVPIRQRAVDDGSVEAIPVQLGPGIGSVDPGKDTRAGPRQSIGEGIAVGRVVLDNQDSQTGQALGIVIFAAFR
jgi:hypothetical protein